jgi:hypothetical protein
MISIGHRQGRVEGPGGADSRPQRLHQPDRGGALEGGWADPDWFQNLVGNRNGRQVLIALTLTWPIRRSTQIGCATPAWKKLVGWAYGYATVQL